MNLYVLLNFWDEMIKWNGFGEKGLPTKHAASAVNSNSSYQSSLKVFLSLSNVLEILLEYFKHKYSQEAVDFHIFCWIKALPVVSCKPSRTLTLWNMFIIQNIWELDHLPEQWPCPRCPDEISHEGSPLVQDHCTPLYPT